MDRWLADDLEAARELAAEDPGFADEVPTLEQAATAAADRLRRLLVPRDPDDDRDVIIKVTSCAICGSDLHLMGGFMPTMECGDILGHEPMGIVEEVGSGTGDLRVGDRVRFARVDAAEFGRRAGERL